MKELVTLFFQHSDGDYNLEIEHKSSQTAHDKLHSVKADGGYWTKDNHGNEIFVPWHKVDYVRITKEKTMGQPSEYELPERLPEPSSPDATGTSVDDNDTVIPEPLAPGIEKTSNVMAGEPCLAGLGVTVYQIVNMFLSGQSVANIAGELGIDELQVEQGLRYGLRVRVPGIPKRVDESL